MNLDHKSYPAYKDSGVPWLVGIPSAMNCHELGSDLYC